MLRPDKKVDKTENIFLSSREIDSAVDKFLTRHGLDPQSPSFASDLNNVLANNSAGITLVLTLNNNKVLSPGCQDINELELDKENVALEDVGNTLNKVHTVNSTNECNTSLWIQVPAILFWTSLGIGLLGGFLFFCLCGRK